MSLITLTWKSLLSRKWTVWLCSLSVALTLSLVLTLQTIKSSSEDSFTQTISQVDLLVGARGGQLQLLLFSVFNMGSATNNISIEAYEKWKNHKSIEWTIPISLGDSFKGFRVVGTNLDFFKHYRFKKDQSLKVESGRLFNQEAEVVLGSQVAKALKLKLNDQAIITHGVTKGSGVVHHDDEPFQVVGILEPTGTVLDSSVYVTLEGMDHLHHHHDNDHAKSISAFYLRTKNRVETLQLQREINEWKTEPMMAILPGYALSELWNNLSYFENILQLMVGLVALFGAITLVLLMTLTLESRRREIAILRSVGASPRLVSKVILLETLILTVFGSLLGLVMSKVMLIVLNQMMIDKIGLVLSSSLLSLQDLQFILVALIVGGISSLIPSYLSYQRSLKEGLIR
jgi:putative ABC transport system permease protein